MDSHFKTQPILRRPSQFFWASPEGEPTEQSRFCRAVSIRPGAFLPLLPKQPDVLIPKMPKDVWEKISGEMAVTTARKYIGRLEEVRSGVLECTLWEVPNGRELISFIEAGDGVEVEEALEPGMQLEVWTWEERDPRGTLLERVHVKRRTH